MVTIPRARAFATAGVEPWEQHNADSLIALACRPPAERPFAATEVNLQLERTHLARVRGTRHVVERSAATIERSPADAIAVYVTVMGDAVFEQDGRRRVLRPGQLLVCDADRPFLRGFGHGLDELAVKVPRTEFAQLTGQHTVGDPVVVETSENPHGHALARLVARAVRTDNPVPADDQAVLELVAVLAGHAELPVAHRAAARAFIEEHLADPALSACDIATATGISERHLSRLFAAADTSVPKHVLARRLDAAHSVLTTDKDLRTADVAVRCGFTSVAYFSQSFRKRFGVTAGEVRRGFSFPPSPPGSMA
ncbi:helix-turn-helix domain-containing protein [Labedaea rhizosphaerae]|uniref:AraC family transcriptional regulator n=1 Tax=Labedaea rhizosphaerae TaxID=598644 RepID=A0A4V3CYN8_LABRH|nr:helix-turn-helix domain-containing protein [Labedaea rhizosphaerae]TDP94848.1 AraC family transcriptional regulator [Labedaea rhizosphaerae]